MRRAVGCGAVPVLNHIDLHCALAGCQSDTHEAASICTHLDGSNSVECGVWEGRGVGCDRVGDLGAGRAHAGGTGSSDWGGRRGTLQ